MQVISAVIHNTPQGQERHGRDAAAQSGVKVNMLTPMDHSIEKSVHNLVQENNFSVSRTRNIRP